MSTPSGRNSNCRDDGCKTVCTPEELFKDELGPWLGPLAKHPMTLIRRAVTADDPEVHVMNKLTTQSTFLTCATITSKIVTAVGGCPCVRNMLTSENSSDLRLQECRGLGGSLDRPSAQFTKVFLLSQKYADQHWKQQGTKPKTKALISSQLKEQNLLTWLNCKPHHSSAVEEMMLNHIRTRIIHLKRKECYGKNRLEQVRVTRQILQSSKSTSIDRKTLAWRIFSRATTS